MLSYKIKMTYYKYLFIFRNISVNKNVTPVQNEIKYNTVMLVYIYIYIYIYNKILIL